jgi:peptidoglycan/xylan/chitin deacetylase (PgdA/CDA1 family)
MCACELHRPGLTRRNLLAGFAGALALPVSASRLFAAEPPACFGPAALAASPTEELPRHPTAVDAIATPNPVRAAAAVTGALAGVIRRVALPEGKKLLALTLDLCQTRSPITGYDGAIVDCLRANRVPATFFAGGRWLKTHTVRAAQLAADPLFELGNHSWSHPDLHYASAEGVTKEILVAEAALAETRRTAEAECGIYVDRPGQQRLFRFPYGSCSEQGLIAANGVGSVVIQWDVVSGDPDGTPAAIIVRNVLSGVRPGSIVVMHANGRGTHTAEALATVIPKLAAEGYRFVTVADLLAAGRPVTTAACYIDHPGDTARYDDRAKQRKLVGVDLGVPPRKSAVAPTLSPMAAPGASPRS